MTPLPDRVVPRRMRFLATTVFVALTLVSLTGAPSHALAATRSRTSALADTTRPAVFLKEMLVTGTRYPRAYLESPQALSFIDRMTIREAAPTTIGDVLSMIPGSDESKDSPWEQRPALRGLGGQRVLVLMDGMPINSARGNGPHPGLVAPEQVDRIEVVRGPSSVAYGSDALGGVINIITRQKRYPDTGEGIEGTAQIGGSSADKQSNGYLELTPHAGRLSSVLSIGGRNADDFRAPTGTVPHSGFNDVDGLANVRYDVNPTLALKVGYQGYRGHDIGIPGLSSPVVDYGPGWNEVFNFKYYDRDDAHVALDHSYTNSWLATSTVKAYWQRERRNFYSAQELSSDYYPYFGYVGPADSHSHTDQDRLFDLNTVGAQAQLTTVKTAHTRFTAGVDAVQDQTSGDNRAATNIIDNGSGAIIGSAPTVLSQSVPTGRFENAAVYLQGEWYLAPRWTLNAGARGTHYHDRADGFSPDGGITQVASMQHDNDALCGTLGLVFAVTPELHLSANVANGYREPNAQDLYFNGPASVGFVLGDPTLKPEKSISYDTGVRWEHGELGLSGNAFYSTYDDLIDAINVTPPNNPPGAPNTFQYTNITKARTWGGEAEGNWRFRRQWELRGQFSGVVGDVTSRNAILQLYALDAATVPLSDIPPFRGSGSIRWNSADERFWIEPGVRYSWRYDRLPPPIPGVGQFDVAKKEWLVGDVALGYKTGRGQRLVAGVRNLGNVSYRPALSSLDEPGVNVYGTISTDF